METIVIVALIAAGVLALAFSGGGRGRHAASAPDDAMPPSDSPQTIPPTALPVTPDDGGVTVTVIDDTDGEPLKIWDFDPATDRIELDLDRRSFGDVSDADLTVWPDPLNGQTRLLVSGQVIAVVHGSSRVDPAHVRVFVI